MAETHVKDFEAMWEATATLRLILKHKRRGEVEKPET